MNTDKSLFSPITNRRAFEKVSLKIKTLIFDGILKPGDKLPSETDLARQFSVGRQTIREALRILELSGFITIHKGGSGGPIIKDTILNTISALFLDAFRMKKISLVELTVARLEIERVVLNYVMDSIDDSDIKSLHESVDRAKKKIENNIIATEENLQFHKLLAKASKNHVFVLIVETIMAAVADFLSRIGPDVETSNNVVEYHERILKAIVEKKREKALDLLEKHLLEVRRRLQPFIDQEERADGKEVDKQEG